MKEKLNLNFFERGRNKLILDVIFPDLLVNCDLSINYDVIMLRRGGFASLRKALQKDVAHVPMFISQTTEQ